MWACKENKNPKEYRVAPNFCGSLFLRITGDFLYLRKPICAIVKDWISFQGTNF